MKLSDLGRLITDIPSNDFNHVIVAIPKKEGGYLYIDPTLPFAPYDFLTPFEENRQVIILDRVEPHFETTPDLPVEKSNRLHSKGTTKINVDGSMDSEGVLQYSGLRGMDFRNVIRHTNPSLLRDLMERGLKARYPQSKLESYELSDTQNVEEPFTFKVKGKLIGPVQVAGNLLLVDQSPSESVVGLASLVTFDQRIYPLFLGVGVMDSVEDVIIPPEGYIPKSIPENLSLIKPFGSYERHVEKQGNQLIWKVTFVVDQPVIPVEIYPEFKAFIEKISAAEQEKMVFEKPPTL
ncbi:MAG: hypothetical protein HY447_00395 [Candidatus Omnitrophica bacterium]|nr:hypothetical protein [Candidatus Omnitrophota bacterium]